MWLTTRVLTLGLVLSLAAAAARAQSPPAAPDSPTPSVPPAEPPKPPKPADKAGDPKDGEAKSPGPASSPAPPADLKPTVQMRGRIEAEAVMSSQSQENKDRIGDLQNGYGFRRVRLGAQGTIGDSASWVSEVELAGGSVRLRDVFVGLDALPWVRQVRVGHFREPYSLEGMTSSNFMTFLERSPQNVISPARNWGVCGFWWPDDERVLFSLGVFRDGTGSNGQSLGDGTNNAFTARLTGLPLYDPDGELFRLVHVGGAVSQRTPPNGVLTFNPRTGSSLLTVEDNPGSPVLASFSTPVNSYQLYNLQAAGVRGPLSVQGEWSAAAAQQTYAGVAFVHGSYLAVSYFLTGEHRGYNRTRGSFDQVDVRRPLVKSAGDTRGGWGAVELTTRLAYLDFTSPNLPPDSNGMLVRSRLYEATLGVNWYLNSYTRVMVNYAAEIPTPVGMGSTVAHVFGIRTALYW